MKQIDLDFEGSRQAADLAIDRVGQAADPDWLDLAAAAIKHLAETRPAFTSDQVWQQVAGASPPREPRALGVVMRRAAKAGLIEATGRWIASGRVAAHSNPKRIWRSLVYRGPRDETI